MFSSILDGYMTICRPHLDRRALGDLDRGTIIALDYGIFIVIGEDAGEGVVLTLNLLADELGDGEIEPGREYAFDEGDTAVVIEYGRSRDYCRRLEEANAS